MDGIATQANSLEQGPTKCTALDDGVDGSQTSSPGSNIDGLSYGQAIGINILIILFNRGLYADSFNGYPTISRLYSVKFQQKKNVPYRCMNSSIYSLLVISCPGKENNVYERTFSKNFSVYIYTIFTVCNCKVENKNANLLSLGSSFHVYCALPARSELYRCSRAELKSIPLYNKGVSVLYQ